MVIFMSNARRIEISEDQLERAFASVVAGTRSRMQRHGQYAHFSRHESHGIIVEETDEMFEAVRSKDREEYYTEVMDVIVAGIWALASRTARDEE